MYYGKLFRILRKRKGYTSQEVADALYVSRSTYSRYENNIKKVEPDILESIAKFYGTTVEDFMFWREILQAPNYPNNLGELRKEGKLPKQLFNNYTF